MRIIINTADIQKIYDYTYKRAWYLLSQVKASLGKEKHQDVTIKEFCQYQGLNEKEVIQSLNIK